MNHTSNAICAQSGTETEDFECEMIVVARSNIVSESHWSGLILSFI